MIDRRVEVVARLKALEEAAAPLVAFLQNPNAVQELKADKQYNLQMLIERYQVCVSKFWIFVFSVSLKFVWRFLIVWWFIEFVVMILMFIWVLGGWGFGLRYLGLDFIMSDTLGKLSVKDGSEFLWRWPVIDFGVHYILSLIV